MEYTFIDEPVALSVKDLGRLTHNSPKAVREQIMPDGTKFTEFPGGVILAQSPFRKDGWLSKALGEAG